MEDQTSPTPERKKLSIALDKDRRTLVAALLLALINGLVYVFILPPWQHYDEPNHFEYVWLATNMDRLPQPGDASPKLSRQVLRSMIGHHFFDHIGGPPELNSPRPQVTIPGYSQLGEPPAYYLYAGLPLRFLSESSVRVQLTAARLMSLSLFLLVVLCAWGAAREVFSASNLARRLVPISLALLPGVAELMTAVNNDIAAVAIFSLFFWGAMRLFKRLSLVNLIWITATAVAAMMAKNTAMIALPLLLVVLLFGLLRGQLRRFAWGLLAVMIVAVLAAGLTMDDAQGWYRATSQEQGARTIFPGAPEGQAVFELDSAAPVIPGWSAGLFQIIPPEEAKTLYGHTLTLGVWMWSDRPVTARTPELFAPPGLFFDSVELTTKPQFFAIRADLPQGKDRIWINLAPKTQQQAVLYYDGFVLALGEYPLNKPPKEISEDGLSGSWGGKPYQNLLRNPSAEKSALRVRAALDNPSTKVLPDEARPTLVMAALQDWAGSGYYLRLTAWHLFETFWARFGWGHIPLLLEGGAYPFLLIITALAGIGMIVGLVRSGRFAPGDAIALAVLALLAAWTLALVRGVVYLGLDIYYHPTARHAYPTIIPAVMGLVYGWVSLGNIFKLNERWQTIILTTFFILLNLWSYISINAYFPWS